MKKTNQNILIYSSAIKALSHLDKVDIHPGTSQRKLDAAYQRLEDIRDISLIVVDQNIDEKMEKKKAQKTLDELRLTQGKRRQQVIDTELAAIGSVCVCILFIILLAIFK